jgi:hypothetical protein
VGIPDAGIPLADAGTSRRDGGIPLPPEVIEVEVQDFAPRRGPSAGGTAITLTGRGFVPGTTVTVGGAPLVDLAITAERKITGRTPPGTAGVAPVLVENRAARVEVPGGFLYEDPVSLASVSPGRGPAAGGTAITVSGTGFVEGSSLLVGPRAAFAVQVDSPGRLRAVTPPGAPGPTSVTVVNRNGTATAAGAFVYLEEVALEAIEPPGGPVSGGNAVRIVGRGFETPTEVYFGSVPASSVVVATPTQIRAVVPGVAAPGTVDVTVRTADGAARLRSGYAYFAPDAALAVAGVVPGSGPAGGGIPVAVIGTGFDAGVLEVRFGGAAASNVFVESASILRALLPRGAPGLADVTVAGAAATAVLPAGFLYEPSFGLSAVTPTSGPAAGGTEVEIRGEGFAPGLEVFFGPLAAPAEVVDETTVRARTPPAAGGPVDVMVRLGERRAILSAAFTYVAEPRVLRVTPARGAVAGGTFTTITGTGFTPETRPFFGGAPAVDVSFVSAGILTARAPPGEPGVADVSVLGDGGSSTLRAAYTYFDPVSRWGGTSGPAIAGAVNVTVLDAWTGRRIPGAFATLAKTGSSAYQGVTNARGQIVFSGPELAGRQVVTAVKEGYTAASIVDFDAENVTLFLNPLSVSVAPGPPPPPPPIVRGVLKSAFKPIPPAPEGFYRAIIVTTTAPDRSRAGYIPPGFTQVLTDDGREDRPYEVATRYGDVAVYALGGFLSNDATRFIPQVMGIHRYVTIRLDTPVVEGIDVTLGGVLNATLDARLERAPPLSQEGPNTYKMQVYLELGIDGVVTFFQEPQSVTEPRLVQEHVAPIAGALAGASYTVIAGAYQVVDGYETVPLSEVTREGVTDLSAPISLGPLMGIARAVRPREGDSLEELRFSWTIDHPPAPSVYILYLPQQLDFGPAAIWQVIVPGTLSEFRPPDLSALYGLPELGPGSVASWYVVAADAPDFHIDAFDFRSLYRNWRSYSMVRHSFVP